MRSISDEGRSFIEQQEGLSLTAYFDVDGYSIGYGHHGGGVVAGMTITQAQADAFLASDLVWVEAAVCHLVTVALTDNQFSALCDFVYNEGAGALQSSTTLIRLNAGDYQGAADALLLWERVRNSAGDLVDSPALLARRQAERAMFLRPDQTAIG